MSRADAHTLLCRSIERSADAAGLAVAVLASQQTRWASATFVGARHELRLEGSPGAMFDAWLAGLPEADLPLRGHLVADLKIVTVVRDERTAATIEALTVEER